MLTPSKLALPYVAAALSVLGPLIAIPFLVKKLGVDGWGLLSLALLIWTFALILEQGVSQAVLKEVAAWRGLCPEITSKLYFLLETYYVIAGVSVAVLALILAMVYAAQKLDEVVYPSAVLAFVGAAVAVPIQMVNSLNRSVMLGRELHQVNSIILIISTTLKHAGAVVVVSLAPYPWVYFAWIGALGTAELCFRRRLIADDIQGDKAPATLNATEPEIPDLLRRSLKMGGAIMLGSCAVYLDRYMVGISLSSKQLGVYTIASTLAVGVVQAVYPLCQTVLPKLVATPANSTQRWAVNLTLFKAISFMVLSVFVVYVTLGDLMLKMWLPDVALREQVGELLSLLLIGSALNAYFNIGYLNWIANSSHSKVFWVYVAALVIMLLATPIALDEYGLGGAPVCWILLNVVCTLASLGWLIRRG